MASCRNKSVTLIELIIAISLVAVIILGINGISIFSHFQVISSDRRAKLQNEVSYCLEHITKQASKAIGNEVVNGNNTVVDIDNIGGDDAIKIFIDYAPDGQRDLNNDRWIAYRFTGAGAGPGDRYQLRYCPECTNSPCTQCNPAWGTEENIISRSITGFIRTKPVSPDDNLNENWVEIGITARRDPANPVVSQDNPEVTMQTTVNLSSVSTN